jgi:H+/Cl- antiporter ClcA
VRKEDIVTSGDQPAGGPTPPSRDPSALLRSKGYFVLLVLAAVLGVPLAAGAFGFLQAVSHLQTVVFTNLPSGLGFHGEPPWWPLLPLGVAGVLVALTLRYLPGTGGHEPAEGFKPTGVAPPRDLPGILVAALISLTLGAVIGPEAPLIALGGGAAAYAVRLLKRGADAQTVALVGATGSFAAISTLLGSPLLGAFLLMEASGIGGPMLGVVLLPGLLASGIGSLIFIGLDSWSGWQTTALTIPNLPPAAQPDVAEFGWALVIGLAAAVLGAGVRRLALLLKAHVVHRRLLLTPLAGLAVAGLAIAYAQGSGKPSSDVLFSGQSGLGALIENQAGYTVGALLLLLACKAIAYGVSLSAFRGGPIFPSMYLGAAGGIAMSHLPGLTLIPGIAMGIGALCVAMLGLPLTAVLLATLLMGKDGITVMPLVIVAVVTSRIGSTWLSPAVKTDPPAAPETAPASGRPGPRAA